MSAEQFLWKCVSHLGDWVWWTKVIMSLMTTVLIYMLPAATSRFGWSIRLVALMGSILCVLSPMNRAFQPFADLLVFASLLLLNYQMVSCSTKNSMPDVFHVRRKAEMPLLIRALSTVTDRYVDFNRRH